MKKIFGLLMAAVVLTTASFAQAKQTDKKAPAKTEVKKETVKPAAKPAPVAAKPAPATTLKKDGTPDKRYKENKTEAKPATGPMKKDGTPDKRYKANKKS